MDQKGGETNNVKKTVWRAKHRLRGRNAILDGGGEEQQRRKENEEDQNRKNYQKRQKVPPK